MKLENFYVSSYIKDFGKKVEIDYRTPPVTAGLIGLYDDESFANNVWSDISGEGNHTNAYSGTLSLVDVSGNGSIKTIRAIQGNTAAGLQFPSAILPSTYTLFHVTRYTGGTKARIFDGLTSNWLSGFWGGAAGVAYHDGWLTDQTDRHGNNWVISTDQNSLYRSNGVQRGTGGGTSKQLTINRGYYSGERSDWQVSFVAVYNRTLSSNEYISVEQWLSSRYGIGV